MQQEQAKNGTAMTLAACLWLGLFPLLQGFSYTRITLDKWRIMLVLCGVTLACFCFDSLRRSAALRRAGVKPPALAFPRLPLFLALLLLLWSVAGCLAGPFGADVWWNGASVRREGLATQLCYLGLFFCFFFSRLRLRPVLFSAFAGVVLFSAVVVLQRLGGNPLGLYPSGRSYAANPEFQGTIGNIDMCTGYLCLLSGFLLHGGIRQLADFRRTSSRSALAALACCAAGLILCVYLVLTMKVQFGVLSLSALLAVTVLRLLPKKARLATLILLLLVLMLVVWLWPGTGGGLWELHEILHGRARLSFGSNRVAVWLYSLRLARENWLLGGGSDTFVLRFNQFLRDQGLSIPVEQDGVPLPAYFDNPHNEYIAQLLNHGLPAMLLFVLLVLAAVIRGGESGSPSLSPWSAAVLCYAVQAFFSFSVCMVAPMFWLVLGASFQPRCNC